MTIAGAIGIGDTAPDLARALRAMALDDAKPRLHREAGAVLGVCDDAVLAADGPLVALFHGRLDHAGELEPQRAGRPATATLLDAYRRWADDFPRHLTGDFACALWDGAAQRLLLARDALGVEPLHYATGPAGFRFATEPQGLLALPDMPREIDRRWVARWLALLPHDEPSTAWQGIHRVLPGHVAIVERGAIRQVPHWRPETLPPVRLASDQAYADTARALLDEAIRCRIAGARTVGSQLSAGLDSSTVTVLAARQLAARGQRLAAFTAVPAPGFDGSGPPDRIADEGPLAAQVAASCPAIDHVLVPNDGPPLFDMLDAVAAASLMPALNPMNQTWPDALGREARRRGITVMLCGNRGNMTISQDGSGFLPALARRGRWIALAGHLRALHRTGRSWLALANQEIAPALPAPLRRGLRRLFGRPEPRLDEFSALHPAHAAELGILDEAAAMGGNVGQSPAARRDLRLAVIRRVDGAMMRRAERRRFGYRLCDPTADRRLVEFCLAIPPGQFLLHGQSRSLVRRAMDGLLPDGVRLETRRGLQAADWARQASAARSAVAAELERLERSPLARTCLDLPRLRRLVEDWPQDGWHGTAVVRSYRQALMRGMAVGRFLRRAEGGNE